MASQQNNTKERKTSKFKLKLLAAMCLQPEARNEEKKGGYPGGRFKRFDVDLCVAYLGYYYCRIRIRSRKIGLYAGGTW